MRSLLRNQLIILDEVGYLTLDKTASDHLLQLVNKAYENVSLIVTSNLDFSEWGTLFASLGIAAALLDCLLHHVHVITLRGDSYRMRNRLASLALTVAANTYCLAIDITCCPHCDEAGVQ